MLKSYWKTDVGLTRTVNEDRVTVSTITESCTVAIVADGMGGHQAGDIASQSTIEFVMDSLKTALMNTPADEREMVVREIIHQANAQIFEIASSKEHYRGMGTTLTLAIADEEQLLIAHVGDSRAYLCTHNHCKQLTEDHTLVNELLKSGQISEEEAVIHPRRHVLLRALGTEPWIQFDIETLSWTKGDMLLICSDGLSNLVSTAEISKALRSKNHLENKVDQLVSIALDAGGDDNISVALLLNE
jgi:serine/threonine protein phosphatase PrpC